MLVTSRFKLFDPDTGEFVSSEGHSILSQVLRDINKGIDVARATQGMSQYCEFEPECQDFVNFWNERFEEENQRIGKEFNTS